MGWECTTGDRRSGPVPTADRLTTPTRFPQYRGEAKAAVLTTMFPASERRDDPPGFYAKARKRRDRQDTSETLPTTTHVSLNDRLTLRTGLTSART